MRVLFHRIAIPRRHANDDRPRTFNQRLAAQPAVALESGCLLDAIVLSLSGLRHVLHALLDVDVTSRARTDTATGMLDLDVIHIRHFEQALTLGGLALPFTLVGIRQRLGILQNELHGDRLGLVGVLGKSEMHWVADLGAWVLGGGADNVCLSVPLPQCRTPSSTKAEPFPVNIRASSSTPHDPRPKTQDPAFPCYPLAFA